MSQDFDQGVVWGRALSDIRHLQDTSVHHDLRITALETAWRSGAETPKAGADPAIGKRVALVGAIWTAAAGTAWNADSIAAQILHWFGR